MSRFFIDRPIFAWVIALVIMLAGALAIKSLPVNQYPNIAAPAIQISVTYPGASAQTVQDTVVQVIEQQLSGLDGLRYISSASNSDGSLQITVTFDQGTNPDIAQVQVQNKLQLATPQLPEEVQRQGIRVVKFQINFMLVLALVSTDGRLSNFDLGNLIVSQLQDPISRTKGVGDYLVLGAQNAMRIWVDPAKLNGYQLEPSDVVSAISAQNVQVSTGSIGGLPTRKGVQLNATVIGKTRMRTVDEFKEILVKVQPDGSQVRLKDVADVALGSENYSISAEYNGKPSAGIALRLATGANLLDSVAAVKEAAERIRPYLPEGVEIQYPYETSPVVSASIEAVVHTLFEAIILVFVVMLLFLQNLRATLIPTLAVPVVLLGTFGILYACGFTINVMTMFAMVLAIGLLVDDAIVVVENVERLMTEERLSPKEATYKSMEQISGALVGIGLVISAVFLPMAFFGGSAGIIYRQFAITIISAMGLSVLIALIFTPALCATLLKPHSPKPGGQKGFFGWFNRVFETNTDRYEGGVKRLLRNPKRSLVVYLLLIAGVALLFRQLPTAFLPGEDQGTMMVQIQTPPNSSAERTQQALDQVRDYVLEHEQETVDSAFAVNGFNFAGRGQSSGILFLGLRTFDDRKTQAQSVFALAERIGQFIPSVKDATVIPIVPPAIMEMGNGVGFDLFLQDNSALGHEALMAARDQFLSLAAQEPSLQLVRPNGLNDEAQYQVTIDDEKARALQVSIESINDTMSVAWGSAYVNDFIDKGRVKKVYVQGEQDGRISPEDFDKWYVRNAVGQMVPFSAFATGTWVYGSPKMERYGGISAVEILGEPAPGFSSGDAMAAVERIASQLPAGIGISWTGLSYEERAAGSQAPMLYALSLIMVFLCLAAMYESWSVPVSVLLVVPLGVLGAVAATLGRGLSNDVFFQVGMLTTMGLAAKNAILIVEFAKELYENQGRSLTQAAVEAARLRLRPIIMTSIAFVMGTLPLARAHGPGSGSQHSIGTGVVGGTLAATFLAIFFVPLFYVVVMKIFTYSRSKKAERLQGVGDEA
ncbi:MULTISPECIES: efflux RND transporter permease subunit [unclassified Pseudomonas]|uniref:efflux RND transporter permease subunit n=1 Tax=unclassified Pseudomonas TaxID=196821 RepID=UPI000488F439|nr:MULTISPECIES: efflux RND transporter permease subunit [unclassified Pseudomonas]PXX64540.1 multidrug efflux pump [Pseudomonas sp. LAIL14HWK12:I1]SMD12341.1 multidrug efflux pump [Pseudomonas sp. URIL14HWK12:I5]SOC98442.1 multidrug efflux pump [Pseudomonas sp. LAIL14HWK12:I3]